MVEKTGLTTAEKIGLSDAQKPAEEAKKPRASGHTASAEAHKSKPPETNAFVQTARRIETMGDQWQTAQMIRVGGYVIQDNRAESSERRGWHDRSGERGPRDERHEGARRAEGHGRPAGDTDAEPGTSRVKRPHGSVAAVEADIALKAARFGEKGEKSLSAFEKFLVARFERGEHQAKESADGRFHFLKKTAAEWTGFFEKFVSRTIQRVMGWNDVQGFLFRGLLQQKGASQQGVMISDVMMTGGVDKFARIPVALGKAHQFAALIPGAVLGKEAVQPVVGEQLRYLAVAAQEEGAVQFSRAASRGMFSSQQLESRVAEHLGLVTDFRGVGIPGVAQDTEEKRSGESRRRRGGMWSRLFGGDNVEGDGSVFVPWWRWDREARTGFRRWFVAVFGALVFIVLFFLLIALVRVLRP